MLPGPPADRPRLVRLFTVRRTAVSRDDPEPAGSRDHRQKPIKRAIPTRAANSFSWIRDSASARS